MSLPPLSAPEEPIVQNPTPTKKALGGLLELVQVILISAAIVIPLRTFLVQPFYVKGQSMEPNFYDHEYLFIDKLTYRRDNPKRGDIIVTRYPRDPSEFFIKRVIGLPGETVEVANGKVRIYNKEHENGFVLDEHTYLDQDYTPLTDTKTLKDDEYYLMGDNRAASLDSRIFGPVKRSFLVGKVWVRAYPFDRWKRFDSITYTP
jgi:signal peptidase I